jgi:hypothetical protein
MGDHDLIIVADCVTYKLPCSSGGAFARALSLAEQGRCLRAVSQTAPGRLRASCPPVLWPVRGVLPLDWDRKGRVTPASTKSQEAWPGAEPGCQSPGECRSGAPEGERAPIVRAAAPEASANGNVCWCCAAPSSLRRSALRSLGFLRGTQKLPSWCAKTRARTRRENVFVCVIANEAKQSSFVREVWIASSRSLSSGRPLRAGPVGSSQ